MCETYTKYYDTVYSYRVNIGRNSIDLLNGYVISNKRRYHNKLLYMEVKDENRRYYYTSGDPLYYLDKKTINRVTDRQSTLFIAPECKMPRDLIRKSGYKITNNKASAHYIVIPYKNDYSYEERTFDIYAEINDDVYLMHNKTGITSKDYDKEAIRANLEQRGLTNIKFANDVWGAKCFFLPKFDIYKEIFDKTNPDYKYVFETDVEINYPVNICLETLKTWKYIFDENVMIRLLTSSNCTDYPLTMMYFIKTRWFRLLAGSIDQKVRRFLDLIGFDIEKPIDTNMFLRRDVKPDDWNLLTSYILDELNVSSDGGFTDESLSDLQMRILRYKMCVKLCYITKPLTTDTIKAIK